MMASSQGCETLMALENASDVACSLEHIVHWWDLFTSFSLLASEWICWGEEECGLEFRRNGGEREISRRCEEQRRYATSAASCVGRAETVPGGTLDAARHAHRHGGSEEKIHLESSPAAWARTLLIETHCHAVDSTCGVVVRTPPGVQVDLPEDGLRETGHIDVALGLLWGSCGRRNSGAPLLVSGF